MTHKHHIIKLPARWLVSVRKRTLAVALVLMAPLALASPVLATEPTGDFAVFKQCPRFTAGVSFCVFSQVKGGEVKVAKTAVPIEKTITLQGGFTFDETTEAETFVGALNGETLTKVPQKVPGGLAALVRCNEIRNILERLACELVFENGVTGVTATTELAKPASAIGINTANLRNEEGVALSVPVKVKLNNPFLGNACYIGSGASPVVLNLTTGTTNPPPPNKPIAGSAGTLVVKDEDTFVELVNTKLVDNSFSVPTATGCGGIFAFLIDPIIDGKLGLPSAAGNNTAIQTGNVNQATAERVIESEK